ncbi:antibiotic resistance protein VanZ [Clostridia bacterium]|nr:antibiotic resistance protein VanZ [Clostridia bacterium]
MRITNILQLGVVAFAAAVILTVIAYVRKKRSLTRTVWLSAVRFFGIWYALTAVFLLFKIATIKFVLSGINDASLTGDNWNLFVNLTPFVTIKQFASEMNVVQIFGNLAALLPLPILLRLNFPKMSFRKNTVISAIVTVLIEPMQLVVDLMLRYPYNSIDIDDLILNVIGAAFGLLAVKLIMTVSSRTHRVSL